MTLTYFIKASFKGSTFPSVTSNDLDNYWIPIPFLEEQRQISITIKKETEKIDHAITKAEKQIALATDYLHSLVFWVVTGLLAVPQG